MEILDIVVDGKSSAFHLEKHLTGIISENEYTLIGDDEHFFRALLDDMKTSKTLARVSLRGMHLKDDATIQDISIALTNFSILALKLHLCYMTCTPLVLEDGCFLISHGMSDTFLYDCHNHVFLKYTQIKILRMFDPLNPENHL